jgi:hypothetical protein
MRILQVSTTDQAGGAEAIALWLFQEYQRQNHESWVGVGLKNTDYNKRLAAIGEAIKLQPENAYLYNVYANEIYKEGNRLIKSEFTPDRGLKTLKTARQAYIKVLKCCSNYSAEAASRIISISFQNNEIFWHQASVQFLSDRTIQSLIPE